MQHHSQWPTHGNNPVSFRGKWDEEDVVHVPSGYYSIRRDEIPPFTTTWTNLENIVLSKVGQTKKIRTV